MEDTTVIEEPAVEPTVVPEVIPETSPPDIPADTEATPEPEATPVDRKVEVISHVDELRKEVERKAKARSYYVGVDTNIAMVTTTTNNDQKWTSTITLVNGFVISADAATAVEAYIAAYEKYITAEDYLGYTRMRSGW